MMNNYKTYPQYKDSGIAWLGDIPEHWEVVRLQYLFKEQDGRSTSGNEELLSVSHYTGITKRREKFNSDELITNAASLIGYKIVKQGDLVMNIMLAWNGSLGISNYYGITSPAYAVFKPINVDEKYFGYLLRTKNAQQEFKKHSTGIIDSRLRLYPDKFLKIKSLLPPQEEQTTIARFLDYKLSKINRFIRKKKQLIKLLNEQKAAIINQAVTKGLNPNAKMKDSGIEWLGEIPVHWEVRKLKYLCKITTGNKNTEDKVENGDFDFFVRSQKIEKINSYSFEGEGILTAGDGVGVGKVFHYVNGKFDYHQRVYLFFEFNKTINAKYLFLYLKSHLNTELKMYNAKSTVDSVRLPVLKDFLVAYPDRIEQEKLIDYYEKETATINTTIATIEKEITLVEEYKTALIAEAVTGKIDVRGYEIPEIENEEESYEELEEELSMVAEDIADYQTEETA